jgi:L-cysteine S-thiosulfotransferase
MRSLFAAVLAVVATVAAATEIAPKARRSGYDFASPETRAMQDDDTANPGMLWVSQGEDLWTKKAGAADLSCQDCHGEARTSMKGVAARYPAFDIALGRPIDLEQRINLCRTEHQRADPFAWESEDLLALTAFVANQSRSLPIAVDESPELRAFSELGDKLFRRREGQLNLSCSQCHDDLAGQRLAGALIPQGHANGYPLYRLEWQSMGSFHRRLRNCMTGVRAEPFAWDSPELTDLALFLAWRAQGLKVETPAVRP